MLYVALDVGLPVTRLPVLYPPGAQGWGTQAVLYSAKAREVSRSLIQAYLSLPVATSPRNYSVPESLRKPPSNDGVLDGFDVFLFKALYELNVSTFFYPAVQHMCAPSTCLSSKHWSPFFLAPEDLKKGKGGWH
jgi:hypothetical protein